jgi:hypothetical protein
MKIAGAKARTIFDAPIRELLYTAPLVAAMLGTRHLTDNALIVLFAFVTLNGVFVLSRAKSIIKSS